MFSYIREVGSLSVLLLPSIPRVFPVRHFPPTNRLSFLVRNFYCMSPSAVWVRVFMCLFVWFHSSCNSAISKY